MENISNTFINYERQFWIGLNVKIILHLPECHISGTYNSFLPFLTNAYFQKKKLMYMGKFKVVKGNPGTKNQNKNKIK